MKAKGLLVLVAVLMISSVLMAAPAAGHGQTTQVSPASSSHTSQPGFFQVMKDFFKHYSFVVDGAIWG
jgi:hypothetical protein